MLNICLFVELMVLFQYSRSYIDGLNIFLYQLLAIAVVFIWINQNRKCYVRMSNNLLLTLRMAER